MAKITITCLELITVICVVQTIQLIATSHMHDPSYASINGIRYAKISDYSFGFVVCVFAYMFSMVAACFLVIYKEPCTYFVSFSPENFKLQFWFWIILAVACAVTLTWLCFYLPWRLALLDSIFVLSTSVALLLVSYKLWHQKEEFEDFVERATELNSTNGREMSADQAHTLYKLHSYRKLMEELRKRREANKHKGRQGTPRSFHQFKAVNFEDFLLLSRWLHQLEQNEKPNQLQQKMASEMRSRLRLFDLTDEEREHLGVLAKWDGLQIPEENWRSEVVLDSLVVDKKMNDF